MIKHIVIWKLKEQAHGNPKAVNAMLMKEKLEALTGKIPAINRLEVGIDFSNTTYSADVVLYSEFSTKEALQNYREHPEHQALAAFNREASLERTVVDYEV